MHEKDKQTTLSDHSQISDKDDKLGTQRSAIFPRENEDENELEEQEELLRVQSKSEAMALSQIPLMKDFQKPRRTINSTQSQIFPEINSPISPQLKKNETISDIQELRKKKFELKRKQFQAKYPKKGDIAKFDNTRDEI